MLFPISYISALDKIGMDAKKQSVDFFIYFLPVMVYACNQNSRLQLMLHIIGILKEGRLPVEYSKSGSFS